MRIVAKKGWNTNGCIRLNILMVVCATLMMVMAPQVVVHAAQISKKKLTLHVGDTKTINVSGILKKIWWRSSEKSVATVSTKGKVTAIAAGKATIIAKAGKKSYKCIVTVKKSDSTKRMQTAEREAKKIVKEYVSSDMNSAERAYVLYRWLSENCSWQLHQSAEAYKRNFGNEAYAALVLKKAACSGYAKAYTVLCRLANVPVRHVNANSWAHQWNEVRINGRWVKVDTYGGTFEDSTGIRKQLLDRDTYNEEGRKGISLYRFTIDM